jgi:hypothetical protein
MMLTDCDKKEVARGKIPQLSVECGTCIGMSWSDIQSWSVKPCTVLDVLGDWIGYPTWAGPGILHSDCEREAPRNFNDPSCEGVFAQQHGENSM